MEKLCNILSEIHLFFTLLSSHTFYPHSPLPIAFIARRIIAFQYKCCSMYFIFTFPDAIFIFVLPLSCITPHKCCFIHVWNVSAFVRYQSDCSSECLRKWIFLVFFWMIYVVFTPPLLKIFSAIHKGGGTNVLTIPSVCLSVCL